MKNFLFPLALLGTIATQANAQTPDQQKHWNHCVAVSSTYVAAAAARNHGIDAQAFVNVHAKDTPLSRKQLAGITNDVYFDPRFERAGGEPLRMQVLNICMRGPQKVKLAE
jgi:hypothetical protein